MSTKNKESYLSTAIVPILGLVIGMLSIIASVFMTRMTLKTQECINEKSLLAEEHVKQYEITYVSKQNAYSDLFTAIEQAESLAQETDESGFFSAGTKMFNGYYRLEPYIKDEKTRADVYVLIGGIYVILSKVFVATENKTITDASLKKMIDVYSDDSSKLRADLLPIVLDQSIPEDLITSTSSQCK